MVGSECEQPAWTFHRPVGYRPYSSTGNIHRILPASYRIVIVRSGFQAISPSGVVIGTEGRLSLRYIAFEHVARQAKLVIVGITHGSIELKVEYDAFRSAAHAGRSDDDALASANDAGAFVGAMWTNFALGYLAVSTWQAAALFALMYGAGNGLLTIMRGTVPLVLFDPSAYGRVVGRLIAPFPALGHRTDRLRGYNHSLR